MSARRIALLAGVAATLLGGAAEARTRGLVFGVSAYPHFAADRQLRAPKNDVKRMLKALAARGVAQGDLAILADDVAGSRGEPTRAAILAGLDRLGEEAERGDLVIIYGSGHGSRQAAKAARKADGLEQLFLPRDAAANDGGAEPFRNAIRAPEFGERIDRIRARGADVWFILDSCFSGSASRAFGEGVRDKQIDPAEIGVAFAAALAPDAATPLAEQPAPPPGSGKLAAFYASQPNETAREVALPPNLPLEKRAWGSIFTLALAQALERSRGLTYRQTLVEAGRILRADPAFQARQTPSFEGDGMDGAAPGATGAAEAAWRVVDGVVSAGSLEGLEAGAVVGLYDSAEAPAGKPMARARVSEAEPLQARLAVLKAGCDKADCPTDPKSPALQKAAYARLARPAPGAALKLSPLRPAAGLATAAWTGTARAALAGALAGPLAGRAELDERAPDLVVQATRDGLRISPNGNDPAQAETGPLTPAAVFANPELAQAAVARAVLRARQIASLQKLERAGGGAARGLVVTTEARRFGLDPATKKCAFAGEGRPVAEGAPLELCDKMIVTLENQGREAVLPAAFFLDDGWNLVARRPSCPVGLTVADRLEPGRRLTLDVPYHARSIKPGLAPTTINGIFVVGAPFRPGEADLPNLCGLTAYNDGPADGARGEASDDLDAMIDGATRGGARLPLEETALSLSFWSVKQPVRP
jgi:hypothetical protein